VNLRLMKRPGDDLHQLRISAVAADVLQIAPAVHQQPMPVVEQLFRERRVELPVKLRHHLRDPLFGRWDAAVIGGQS